jgi:hypothetical protein
MGNEGDESGPTLSQIPAGSRATRTGRSRIRVKFRVIAEFTRVKPALSVRVKRAVGGVDWRRFSRPLYIEGRREFRAFVVPPPIRAEDEAMALSDCR